MFSPRAPVNQQLASLLIRKHVLPAATGGGEESGVVLCPFDAAAATTCSHAAAAETAKAAGQFQVTVDEEVCELRHSPCNL